MKKICSSNKFLNLSSKWIFTLKKNIKIFIKFFFLKQKNPDKDLRAATIFVINFGLKKYYHSCKNENFIGINFGFQLMIFELNI